MVSWLVSSTPDGAVQFRALAVDICVLGQDTTLTAPLSTQVYKWVPANLMLWVTLRWTSIPSRGRVAIFLVASCYGNQDKLRPDGPLRLVCRLYVYLLLYLPADLFIALLHLEVQKLRGKRVHIFH